MLFQELREVEYFEVEGLLNNLNNLFGLHLWYEK
jgi:hypothetical protein